MAYVDPAGNNLNSIIADGQIFLNDGNDTVVATFAGYVFVEGGTGNDHISRAASVAAGELYGGAGDDTIHGGLGEEWLYGGSGVDILSGGGSRDHLSGDDGNDDLFGGSGDDNLYGGEGADELMGDAHDDRLFGGDGSDTLKGGSGIDRMSGDDGDDHYEVTEGGDRVLEHANEGKDTVFANITYTLPVNVEDLILFDNASRNGTGNALANGMRGNTGSNELRGLGGDDVLDGQDGVDTLIGGAGRDFLTGGASNDVFSYTARSESVVGVNADRILDFDDAGNDRINLSALFGPAMTYRHNQAFTAPGQVRINDVAGADVIVEVNLVGTSGADFAIRLTGTTLASMTASDFVL
ncbi:MAG TPA: calcium-binding protein [Rhizobiaceae bacterium]|nr:calcium-binding protein [Rhizobiaceae bacterium]